MTRFRCDVSRSRLLTGLAAAALLMSGSSSIAAGPVASRPHVLVYDQTLGFHHISIDEAERALREIATFDKSFTLEITQEPKALSKARLARTDVVMWLSNTAASGRVSPFTDGQEKAYADWMRCGGGHVGVHAAVDSYDDKAFPAYVEANGAIFAGHPITVTSALDDQDTEHEGWGEPDHELRVVDQSSPMTTPWRGQSTFTWRDELYQLDRDPKTKVSDYHLLLSHVAVTDPQGMVVTQVYPGPYDDDAPIAWTGSYKHRNRTFYTNLGHSVEDWKSATFQRHLVQGVLWTAAHHVDRACLTKGGFPG
jgi:type 1 glutamine amidotransferase